MKCLKSSVWNEFTIDEFISECYRLDLKDVKSFNILENIR